MRAWIAAVGLTMLLGCGRVGFGARADGGAGTDGATSMPDAGGTEADSGAVDRDGGAPPDGGLTPLTIDKLTADEPLLRTFAPGSGNCGEYLITLGDGWSPTTFMRGAEIWFAIPCKYSDASSGGWHTAFAHWNGSDPTATWVDGDPATPGIQETLSKFALGSDGMPLNSQETQYYVEDAAGRLLGLGRRYQSAVSDYQTYPIVAPSFEAYDETHWRLDLVDTHELSAADGTWRGQTEIPRDILRVGDAFWIFGQSTNAPISDTSYVIAWTTTDMLSATHRSAPLAVGYHHPFVVAVPDGTLRMVAFDEGVRQWVIVRGTAPDAWNFDAAVALDLSPFQGARGAWDFALYPSYGAQPRIVGAETLGSDLFLFYMAGVFDYPTTPPYDQPRGIGVLRVAL